jgi:hypothetical protein
LISLLGVPFNTFNMFHRWLGRIIAAEAIFHVIAIVVTRAESCECVACARVTTERN